MEFSSVKRASRGQPNRPTINDKMHAENINESITALELLDWMNQERLAIMWSPDHDAFIVQRYYQACGNIGVGKTVIEALRAARTKEGA